MENQVKETGIERLNRLRKEAKEYGITGTMTADAFEIAITAAKANGVEPEKPSEAKGPTGISLDQAKSIEARLMFEEETRDRIRHERQLQTDRAQIIAESQSLSIEITLPDNPTELDLAKARRTLGIKKQEVKPSPETVQIEATKRGYYVFTNREQDDASHTVNLGGKYPIHLIPDQVHVLSEFHVRRWKQIAVVPQYKRVPTGVAPSDDTTGQVVEQSQRIGDKPRFAFEYLGEAPQDAPFGLVTDAKVLKELLPTESLV